jgi:hypothetical protein
VTAGAVAWRRTRLGPGVSIARTLSVLARLTFAILIVVLPFRARVDLVPHPAVSISAVLTDYVIYAIDVLVVATLALWLVGRAIDRRPIALGPVALRVPVVLLVVLAWVSIASSVEPAVSVAGAIRITLGATLALYVLNEVDGLESLAVPIGAMLALQAVVAVGQAIAGGPVGFGAIGELNLDPLASGTSVVTLEDGSRQLRAYGLTPHPNVLGGFLACGLLLLLGAPVGRRDARVVQALVVVGAGVALLATFSRGAWLGALIGFGVGLALLAGAEGRVVTRGQRWLVIGALAFAAFGAAGWVAGDAVVARTGLSPAVAWTEQRSIEERLAQIRLGWRVVLDRPLTGAGASALPIAMQALEPDFPFGVYPPHVVVLAVAGELGLPGAIAYLGMLGAPWLLLARSRRRWTLELIAASASLAALAVVSIFDIYPWAGGPGRTLGWLVVGLWAMAWVRGDGERKAQRHPGPERRALPETRAAV